MVYYNQYKLVMRPEFPIIYPIIYQTFPVKVLYLKKKIESFPSGWGGGQNPVGDLKNTAGLLVINRLHIDTRQEQEENREKLSSGIRRQ